ncbi:hypothetical protein C8E03_10821 [Lachnotalea glycerini]|uniref:Uncharacterized protein n=1 Tax=Lachnotalea glycerini TaxID=1763509 RepID=A0A255IS19_9FIRM|nr:hypothetical protein [Lachnotalea glycerini]PXV88300.1 hypothetical protein C8E03_10821 [Lachnotalea glycerini]RDY30880.1 hypothetical protein CG710_012470 [Lachnotalea glycerini]
MCRILDIKEERILKLTNIIERKINDEESELGIDVLVNQIDNYIISKGAKCIGPLIHISEGKYDNDMEFRTENTLMRQLDRVLHHPDKGYKFYPILKIKNCYYCRFSGEEGDIHFAVDKIRILAYENYKTIKSKVYVVYISNVDSKIVADIFVERVDE